MGVTCSHVGAVRVVPDRFGGIGTSLSLKTSQLSTKRCVSVRRSAGDGSPMMIAGEVLDIQMDACLLPVSKVSKNLNIEVFKHPIIVVTITVAAVDKTKLNVISGPVVDWGELALVNQVPKSLPESMSPGSYVIHAVLAKNSDIKDSITFRGQVNGEKIEFSTEIEDDVPYWSNPVVLAEALMVFQSQLQNDSKSLQTGKARTSKDEAATANTCRSFTSQQLAAQDVEEETSDAGMVTKRQDTSRQIVSKRKNTPFVTSLPKSVNVSLKNMVEAMSLREEEEEDETGDEFTTAWHMSRRMSGRMSRLSRRFSLQSIGRESVSSLFVNPPGTGHRSRLSRSRSSRWNERSSVIEYRQRPGEVSDFETSASESDLSYSVMGGTNVSESSYALSEPRQSEEQVILMSWSPLGPGSGDRKQVSSEEKLTPEEKDRWGVLRKQFEPAQDTASVNVSSAKVNTSRRQRRATPRGIKLTRKQSLTMRSPVHVIREEEGFDEGTETDGHMSSQDPVSYRRKMSGWRKKRHFRSSLSATDLMRRMEYNTSLSPSPSTLDMESSAFTNQKSVEERECVKHKEEIVEVTHQKEEATYRQEGGISREKEMLSGNKVMSRRKEEVATYKENSDVVTSMEEMVARREREEEEVTHRLKEKEMPAQKQQQLPRKEEAFTIKHEAAVTHHGQEMAH